MVNHLFKAGFPAFYNLSLGIDKYKIIVVMYIPYCDNCVH